MLFLPSQTYRAKEFLDAAARLGVDVVSASDTAQAMAASFPERFVALPLHEPGTAARIVERFAKSTPIDAVVAVDDESALAAAYAAQRLGIDKNPLSAIEATRDKVTMRRLLATAGVSQPPFAIIDAGENEHVDVADAADLLGYPVVIKPVSLSASRGVERVDDAGGARRAAARTRRVALSAGCAPDEPLLVERYVGGDEIALEGMLTDGALSTLAIFDKPDPLTGPYFEETIYVTPSRHHPGVLVRVEDEIKRACGAIGLVDGPVHAEARLSPSGADPDAQVIVLEAAGAHDRRQVLEGAPLRIGSLARRARAGARARHGRRPIRPGIRRFRRDDDPDPERWAFRRRGRTRRGARRRARHRARDHCSHRPDDRGVAGR